MKYRKKPIVIEAIQWVGGIDCEKQINDFTKGVAVFFGTPPHEIRIETLEGTMTAEMGDWIIKGVKGEFYPCKPDIFEATYEPIEE